MSETANDQWTGILSDADAKSADATVAMIRRETFVSADGRSLTFGKVTG